MLAQFKFQNHLYNLLIASNNNLFICINRIVRTTPFIGMKQPVPQSAFLGLDTILLLLINGQSAEMHPWILYKDAVPIQNSSTNEIGISNSLLIDLPNQNLINYSIEIYKPGEAHEISI